MSMKPCRLCGSAPVIQVMGYNVCCNQLIKYRVICSFCDYECRSFPSPSEAIDDWNKQNEQVKHCA